LEQRADQPGGGTTWGSPQQTVVPLWRTAQNVESAPAIRTKDPAGMPEGEGWVGRRIGDQHKIAPWRSSAQARPAASSASAAT